MKNTITKRIIFYSIKENDNIQKAKLYIHYKHTH